MATYLERYNLLSSATMRARLLIAVVDAAIAITNEADGTANHANRLLWANQALESQEAGRAMAEGMLWDVMQNPTIAASGEAATDSDLAFVVTSLLGQPARVQRWIGG